MTVSLEKARGTGSVNPGAAANDGSGPLRLIGGVPAQRVNGPVIRVTGPKIGGAPVRCVKIEPVTGEWYRTVLVTADGREHCAGLMGDVEALRDAWIRYALSCGIFAGVARMR